MRLVISGSSGLIGTSLVQAISAGSAQVTRLVRSADAARAADAVRWDPGQERLDPQVLAGADAVINLNGRNLGDARWSESFKARLASSRLDPTRTLVEAIRRADPPPRLLVNASAAHYYGDRGQVELDETEPAGDGFLAGLCKDWERAAGEAASEDTRVVVLRFGMVIARGGALDRLLTPFKLGLGGPIGSGDQWWPWVGIDDLVGAVRTVLANPEVSGPVNVVSPDAVRSRDFAKALGRVLHRPAVLPLPGPAARLVLGEMADELLLASVRIRPAVLEGLGYGFRFPDLEDALRHALS